MPYRTALKVFDSKNGTPFDPIVLSKQSPGSSRFDNSTTVNVYCHWLKQMGADFELRWHPRGFWLLKSNVQEIPRVRPEKPVARLRTGGIRKRTGLK